ncbi:MAG: PTS glucose transporter subunit IIA [Fusobacterium perfoetens]|uniref:PTS sugar transporter subunit IIA n=1 Tax=Fusobacterium perfoetens TaxID=852 RepID=UPI0023F419F6|nr:PTS glucose transporter subunit IIA [Fusobacterium perfoetens]MCI6153137.1 PTS glucose transporter subunit IIA [Fusobacterium perfoetens]MDY3237067.1 PTS glucose transporter subunit IIA [Fusobacterium perfoetens]
MGLFDIFKNKKKEEKIIEIYSPLNGKVISLEEVPDEAFSQKMVGDGCAIEPIEGAIYSPLDCEIDIFETNHAVSIETPEGLEMIIHFGVDTVKLKGEGLKRVVNPGDVKKGEKLVEYDLEFIKTNAKSVKTPIIISSMDMVEKIEVEASGEVKVGDLLMKVYLK